MRKKFMLDSPLNLPQNISKRKVNGYNLFIAKYNPTWIVLDEIEKYTLERLISGETLRRALFQTMQSFNLNEKDLEERALKLLSKIDSNGFYKDATEHTESEMPLFLLVTNKCNLHCGHCYVDAGEISLEEELNTNQIKRILDEFSDINRSRVAFSGGEPLIRNDFFELVEYAKLKGHKLYLLTNGTLIDKEKAKNISDYFDFVQISLDGATPEINDFYRGKGSFWRIINGINSFADTNLRVNIGMVLTPINFQDIKTNLSNIIKEHIHSKISISVGGLLEKGRGRFCEKGDSQYFIEQIIDSSKELDFVYEPGTIQNRRVSNCGYAEGININANGDIYLCPMITDFLKFSNIRELGIRQLSNELRMRKEQSSVENIEQCNSCDLEYFCGGTCRLRNYEINGDMIKPTCDDEFKIKMYKHMVRISNS